MWWQSPISNKQCAIPCSYLLHTCKSHIPGAVPSENDLEVHGHLSFHSREMTNLQLKFFSSYTFLMQAYNKFFKTSFCCICGKYQKRYQPYQWGDYTSPLCWTQACRETCFGLWSGKMWYLSFCASLSFSSTLSWRLAMLQVSQEHQPGF